jgi:sigma-B regulation protein RsbU (phosphoserine phosphatase)
MTMHAAPDTELQPREASSRLRVLLIEDNPGDVRLIQEMLAESGNESFDLEHVDRLAAGLERISQGGIGMVLVDLSLPDSQGLATFTKVRAHAPRLPILVMSGQANETVAVNAVHAGAQDYLVKGHVDGYSLVRAMRYAIERKRLSDDLAHHADELRRKNTQMEEDLLVAREIQQLFLPPRTLHFPASLPPEECALRFHSLYLAPTALSGDFFNIYALNEHTVGVFICDVMGHGVRAALITAVLRTLVDDLRSESPDPGSFMKQINRRLHAIIRRTEAPTFATAFYLVADAAAGTMSFTGAGHPSPLRMAASARTVHPLRHYDARHGPALGLFEHASYPTCHAPMAPGDRVLFFTDGLYEIEGPRREEFGLDRLLAAVQVRNVLPTEALFESLLTEVRQFAAGAEFDDDVCLVAMEVHRLGLPASAGAEL